MAASSTAMPEATTTAEDPDGNLTFTDPLCHIQDSPRSLHDYYLHTNATQADIAAGSSMLAIAVIFIAFNSTMAVALIKLSAKAPAYTFLASMTIVEIFEHYIYLIQTGATILARHNMWPYNLRVIDSYVIFLFWMIMAYHYIVIAASRLGCMIFLSEFDKKFPRKRCLMICAGTWLFGLGSVILVHAIPGYQILHFDYNSWGFYVDRFGCWVFAQELVWFSFNTVCISIAGVIYLITIIVIVKMTVELKKSPAAGSIDQKKYLILQVKLVVACMFNAAFFVGAGKMGELAANTSKSKWITWFNDVLFAFNSTVDPMTYIVMSSELRATLLSMLCGGSAKVQQIPKSMDGTTQNDDKSGSTKQSSGK